MNIIIAGMGKAGASLTRALAQKGHSVVAIDAKSAVLEKNADKYDIMTLEGNCLTTNTLLEANIDRADVLIAVTGSDEANLLCCLIARKMNKKIHTIPRVRNPEYLEQIHEMREDFGVSMIINPDSDAAIEMHKLIQLPGFLKRETFAKGRVEIVELKIEEDSPLVNAEMKSLPEAFGCKALVCAVTRGDNTFIPSGGDVLLAGDHVFVTAPVATLSKILVNLGITTKRINHVMIVGGGRLGFYLAKVLLKSGLKVKILEQDKERCLFLAQELPGAVVVCADGSSQEVLESEGLANMDALITLTGYDEINMIISIYGAAKKIRKVITKINRMESTALFEKMGIGSIINSASLSESNVVQYVSAMENQTGAAITLHAIANGQAEALEFNVDDTTLYKDTPLKNVPTKKNVLISCINHNGTTIIPEGNSSFSKGDTVVVVVSGHESVLVLNDIFEQR